MKIYFTTSTASAMKYKADIEKTLKILKDRGHTIELRPKLIDGIDVEKKMVTPEDTAGLDFVSQSTSIEDLYNITQKKLLKCDMIIAEMSYGSSGVGYDVAQGIIQNKPVLVLSNEKDSTSGNNPISGKKSKNVWVKTYNHTNLENYILEFIDVAKKMLDSKFILIIPPEIERYLSWGSNKKGIRKAEIVRSAIEEYMGKDEDYKKYMSTITS